MEWYEQWFSKEYAKVYSHRDDKEANVQIEFLKNKIPLYNIHSALDIACGNGRQAIRLSNLIKEVHAIDLSDELLEIAKNEAKEKNSSIKLHKADMRDLPFENQSFDLISNFFTGFGYFKTDSEHQKLLYEWSRVCRKKAFFLLDYLNKDYVINTLVPSSKHETEDYVIEQIRSITTDNLRVEKTINITDKKTSIAKTFKESVRMYNKEEIYNMLQEANFMAKETYGDFHASNFNKSSKRLVVISQKI